MSEEVLRTIGSILTTPQNKDAVHMAIVPVTAAQDLMPGQHIGPVDSGMLKFGADSKQYVGIVDPFIKQPVGKGQEFWLFLYPGSITSLRHDWTHPVKFSNFYGDYHVTAVHKIADSLEVDYDELMNFADGWVEDTSQWPDYWCDGGRFDGVSLPDSFWKHYEAIRKVQVNPERKHSFFTCSC